MPVSMPVETETPTSPFVALHLKYRPTILSDLVGQESVKSTLTNAIKSNHIVPAYMFCGTRGSGKTSTARAFARALNCLESKTPTVTPCGECASCRGISNGSDIDVIELDAASNNGVDDVRELIERAGFSPVRGRWKAIIIDEVHELSSRAQNALLKTLEEPPQKVVFMLATTDPQKVLSTIMSRCQVHTFKRLHELEIARHLEKICEWEGIKAEPDGLVAIAALAEGGLRNALTLLGKLADSSPITLATVQADSSGVPEEMMMSCIAALFKKDMGKVVAAIQALMDTGHESSRILEAMIRLYRDLTVLTVAPGAIEQLFAAPKHHVALVYIAEHWGAARIYKGLDVLIQAEYHIQKTAFPRLWAEVTLIRLGGLD